MLTPEDVAYMKAAQVAEVLPTVATVTPKASTVPDGLGGYTETSGTSRTLAVRVTRINSNRAGEQLPMDVASRYEPGQLRKVHADASAPLLGDGDALVLDDGTKLRVVTDAFLVALSTVQLCWAVRA